jgi:hypothetical protein
MLLQDEHIDTISRKLKDGGIVDARLHADLLDHICCFIEEQGREDFDMLLIQAIHLLAPNGLNEIEEERYFLFHFHKQLTMKRILFFCGFATTFLFTTGFTFKLMHWPAAIIFLIGSYLALILTTALIASNAVRNARSHSLAFNVRIFTGVLAAFLIAVGSIFKLLHYPSANIQFVSGVFLLNFVFLPLFFYQLYNQSLSKTM